MLYRSHSVDTLGLAPKCPEPRTKVCVQALGLKWLSPRTEMSWCQSVLDRTCSDSFAGAEVSVGQFGVPNCLGSKVPVSSGGPKEPYIRWGCRSPSGRCNYEAKKWRPIV